MAQFNFSKTQGLSEAEISNLTDEEKSKEIDMLHAIQMMHNYEENLLEQIENSDGDPASGFYFDVTDIKRAVANLNGKHDKIFIALGKKSPNDTNDDYTLIVSCVEYREDENGDMDNFYIHNDKTHPWFEFSKPCPPKCPKEPS